jgi:hypothetical protein
MTSLPPETEYARRIRARLSDLQLAGGQDAKLIETALSCGFDALSDEQVAQLNLILRRFAALGTV